jgi:hypothetical protein
MNRWRTKSLFLEYMLTDTFANGDIVVPIFTIDDYDKEHTLPNGTTVPVYSFKRLYVEQDDPTEYRQAKFMLGSVDHWEALKKSDWMLPLLRACRKELSLKLESEFFQAIKDKGLTGKQEATQLAAFKTLLTEMKDRDSERPKRGRPSKDEVQKNLQELSKEEKRVQEDWNRITILPVRKETKE